MNLTYKRATIQDIDMLTKTRTEVLRAANQLSDTVDMSHVERESYNYYRNLLDKRFVKNQVKSILLEVVRSG